MKQTLYTLAISHLDGPAAEIFSSERAALYRRLEFSEVDDADRQRILDLFDARDRAAYEEALHELESKVSLACAIEEHRINTAVTTAAR